MPGIPEDRIREVLDVVDIVELVGREVELRRAGSGFKGLCPFHDEKTPSFHVNPERGSYHCFGCDRGGNAFGWIMERLGLSFPEAVRMLATEHGITIEEAASSGEGMPAGGRARALEVLDWAARFFERRLGLPEASGARTHLSSRGFRREAVMAFRLGYASESWDALRNEGRRRGFDDDVLEAAGLVIRKDDGRSCYDRFRGRLMFPIVGPDGHVRGFGARILGEGEPKYLNSPEGPLFNKSRTLFGLDRARDAIRKSGVAVLVEGYTDVVMAHQTGRCDVVAGLGTALTRDHAKLLRRFARSVVLLYDGDGPGRDAAERAFGVLLEEEMKVGVALLSGGLDPCDIAREEGREGLDRRIDGARTATEFLLDMVDRGGTSPEERAAALDEVLTMVARVENPVLRDQLHRELVGRAEIRPLVERTRQLAPRRRREPEFEEQEPSAPPPPEAEVWALESALRAPDERMPALAEAPVTSASVRRIVDRAVTLLEEGAFSPAALLTGLAPEDAALVTRLDARGEVKIDHDRQFLDSLARMRWAAAPDPRGRLAEALRRGDQDEVDRCLTEIRGRSA